MKTYQIEDKNIYDKLNPEVVAGVAKSVDMEIEYLPCMQPETAKGFYNLKDEEGNCLLQGNISIDASNWGTDNGVIIDNFAAAIGVTIIN